MFSNQSRQSESDCIPKNSTDSRQGWHGFTLVELIVSVGIFTAVAVAAIAALITTVEANRRTRSLTETTNNLNFVLQSMVRKVRTGYSYGCNASSPATNNSCPSGRSEFGFVSITGEEIGYELNNDRIQRTVDGDTETITPPEVDITDLQFYLTGSDSSGEQARVLITIEGVAGTGDASHTLQLQTTAAQRLFYSP